MTIAPGAPIEADDMTDLVDLALTPGERIATTALTSASSATSGTTELQIATVTASLITGKVYRVRYAGAITGTVITDHHFARFRENTIAGVQIQGRRASVGTTASGYPLAFEVEFTAVSTAAKTFVLSFQRTTGTGTITGYAASDQPAYFYVDYIRG